MQDKPKLTRQDLENAGFEQLGGRHSVEYVYQHEMGIFSPDHGTFRMKGFFPYIRTVSDLKQIVAWIDKPSNKKAKTYQEFKNSTPADEKVQNY